MATFCELCLQWFDNDEQYLNHRHQPSRFLMDEWFDCRTGTRHPLKREQGTGNSPLTPTGAESEAVAAQERN